MCETADPKSADGSGTVREATCGHALDESLHAACAVCHGLRLCLDCARTHFCTAECPARGCLAGLCVKLVRDGVVADAYGVPPGEHAVPPGEHAVPPGEHAVPPGEHAVPPGEQRVPPRERAVP